MLRRCNKPSTGSYMHVRQRLTLQQTQAALMSVAQASEEKLAAMRNHKLPRPAFAHQRGTGVAAPAEDAAVSLAACSIAGLLTASGMPSDASER